MYARNWLVKNEADGLSKATSKKTLENTWCSITNTIQMYLYNKTYILWKQQHYYKNSLTFSDNKFVTRMAYVHSVQEDCPRQRPVVVV